MLPRVSQPSQRSRLVQCCLEFHNPLGVCGVSGRSGLERCSKRFFPKVLQRVVFPVRRFSAGWFDGWQCVSRGIGWIGLMCDGWSDAKLSHSFAEVLTVFIRFSLIS